MLDIDETIEALRLGKIDFDCKRMVLKQRKRNGAYFEGQGYVRQSDDVLIFKIYVAKHHNAKPFSIFEGFKSGEIFGDDSYYDLEATRSDGTRLTAARVLPRLSWDLSDLSVVVEAEVPSITARLEPQKQHYLRLHFFEEYEVPLHLMSEYEQRGNKMCVLDRAEFEACGASFEVRKRNGSGDTVVEATSESPFPASFSLRVQEALQYLTGKTAIWRARLESAENELHLELVSPRRRAPRTQFTPPISPGSVAFSEHGWRLFERYLAHMIASNAQGTYWNPIAYHLNNACEATAGSLDAWAVGITVAVEAIASLIDVSGHKGKSSKIDVLQRRARRWLAEQADLQDVAARMEGLIGQLDKKRPQDILHALAATGHVERGYIKAWSHLRQRHVHPKIQDLKRLDQPDYQELIDEIHRAEVLLRQLTFYLIRYEGPFTDYGVRGKQGPPTKQYPLEMV